MSDAPPSEAASPNASVPAQTAPAAEAKASSPEALATGKPIDYALPSKKSFIPSPALIRNIGGLFKLIVGFTVLVCLGYFALVALNPQARQWVLQGSQPGPGGTAPAGRGPTPFKAINQVLAIPARAMGKTDDVVKANDARAGQLASVIAEEEAKAKGAKSGRPVVDPFASPPAPPAGKKGAPTNAGATESGPPSVSSAALLALAEKRAATGTPADPAGAATTPSPHAVVAPAAAETPNQMTLAGDIVISQASPAGAPRASGPFFYSIVKLNVSGITQGKPARALINHRLAHEGDEINRQLGIVFAELDPVRKLLVFRDQSGATVTRGY